MPIPVITFPPMGIDKILTLLAGNKSHWRPISLALGQSDFPIQEYVNLTLQAYEVEKVLGYGDIGGQISLRSKISSFYALTLGVDIPAAQILITDGATGALVLALGLLVRPGSEVILPAVGYAAYRRTVQMFGGIPISAPLDGEFNLSPHQVPNLITAKTAAIIVNSPGNPYGNIASQEMLAEIASLGIPVIFDEVYQLTTFAGDFAPTGTQRPGEHFVINGLAKSFAVPGLRIGFAIVPPSYAEAAQSLKVLLNICPNLPGQLLAERLLERAEVLLPAHRSYLNNSHKVFLEACDRYSVPVIRNSQAGFYGIIALPKGIDSMKAASVLAKDYAVATAPGTDFAETDPGFLRVNFSDILPTPNQRLRKVAARRFPARANFSRERRGLLSLTTEHSCVALIYELVLTRQYATSGMNAWGDPRRHGLISRQFPFPNCPWVHFGWAQCKLIDSTITNYSLTKFGGTETDTANFALRHWQYLYYLSTHIHHKYANELKGYYPTPHHS